MRQIDLTRGWWVPNEIIFAKVQITWLVAWLPVLERGEWPPIPQNETWNQHKRAKSGAYFETPAAIYAEVTYRLDRTGQDGAMLKDFYLWEKSDREMTTTYPGLDIWEIERRVRRALAYISGWKRKRRTYQDFVSHPQRARKFLATDTK